MSSSLRATDMALPADLKLKGIANLKTWQGLIETTLKQNGLWDHLDPEKHKESTSDDKTTAVPAGNVVQNSLVKMMLSINVDPDLVTIIMGEDLVFDGYTSLCRFIEGNTTAVLESSLTHFLELVGNFDTFATPADYILEHKPMVSRQLQLGFALPNLVYKLLFIRAASSKYPQWGANQRFHFSVATDSQPAPVLSTLYMTLQDHARLNEATAPAAPIAQAHNVSQTNHGSGGNKNGKKKEKQTCAHCGGRHSSGRHSSDECFLEYPAKRAAREQQLGKPVKEIPKLRAEFDRHKAYRNGAAGGPPAFHYFQLNPPAESTESDLDAACERRLEKWTPYASKGVPHHVQMVADYSAIADASETLNFQ